MTVPGPSPFTGAGAPSRPAVRRLRRSRRSSCVTVGRASSRPRVPGAPGTGTGFRRAVASSRAPSRACSTCAPPRRVLVPRARLCASRELEGADLPAVAEQLEAGGDGAGAVAVPDVQADLGAALGRRSWCGRAPAAAAPTGCRRCRRAARRPVPPGGLVGSGPGRPPASSTAAAGRPAGLRRPPRPPPRRSALRAARSAGVARGRRGRRPGGRCRQGAPQISGSGTSSRGPRSSARVPCTVATEVSGRVTTVPPADGGAGTWCSIMTGPFRGGGAAAPARSRRGRGRSGSGWRRRSRATALRSRRRRCRRAGRERRPTTGCRRAAPATVRRGTPVAAYRRSCDRPATARSGSGRPVEGERTAWAAPWCNR